uniref:Uncharacterized protein n=1 Tax=Timema poppense TaxID=170557 RepID=A0A7R9DIX0_TIMPO|nr:unnamed protein product [Timema poppensis]
MRIRLLLFIVPAQQLKINFYSDRLVLLVVLAVLAVAAAQFYSPYGASAYSSGYYGSYGSYAAPYAYGRNLGYGGYLYG